MFKYWVLLSIFKSVLCDPCTENVALTGENRQDSYEPTVFDTLLCDRSRITEGTWYRMEAGGGQLPESCVPPSHCGTRAPIFLNGAHPTGNTPTTVAVCANYGSCCDWSEDILVQRCEDAGEPFFVYQLAVVPGCDMAYCVTTDNSCPANTFLDPESGECLTYPSIIDPPSLSDPIAPEDPITGTFKFQCTVSSQSQNQEARFEVQLFFFDPDDHVAGVTLDTLEDDDITVSTSVTVDITNLVAEFDESYLVGHMGKTVACQTRSYFDGSDVYSPFVRSNNWYWIGIRGPENGVQLDEANGVAGVSVDLVPTVPVTCGNCNNQVSQDLSSCRYQFEVSTFNADTNSNNVCTFKMSSNAADNVPLSLTKAPNIAITGVRVQNIQFESLALFPPPPNCIWHNYQPQDIPVTLTDTTPFGHCSSVTDPHTRTFDGKYYHNYRVGQFLFIKSHSLSGRKFEVHVRQDRCWNSNRVACNCAVAVREANTVVIVDYCNFVIKTLRIVADNNPAIGELLWTTSRELKIIMPSGSSVRVEFGVTGRSYINLHVYIPSEDYHYTEGLCGSYDGDRSNDLTNDDVQDSGSHPNEFIESHRIPNGESFFDGTPQCENVALTTEECRCTQDDSTNIQCGEGLGAFDIDVTNVCSDRKKRDTSSIYGDLSYDFENDPDDNFEQPQAFWPTENGYSEEYVTQRCRDILSGSPVYTLCVGYFNEDEFIEGCVEDIRVLDDLSMGYLGLSAIEETCAFTVESQPVNETAADAGSGSGLESGSGDEINSVQAMLEEIRQNICPSQCSQRGTCVNSVCSCETGFTGDDCSIEEGQAPEMLSFHFGPLCDIQTRNCTIVKINASPLTDASDLTCAVRYVELREDGNHAESEEILTIEATFLNFASMRCILPDSPVSSAYQGERKTEQGFLISVSNDGENFSDEELFIIYDSKCRNCNSSGVCNMHIDTCTIDGICYDEEDGLCGNGMCQSYADIGIPERSAAYETANDDTYLCDYNRIVEGTWYRFDQYTGGMMPESCIDNWHCRTQYPIWFNGRHPTAEIPLIEGQVCSRAAADDCCHWNRSIWVRYCDVDGEDFYVYQLVVPQACPMAYCSGNIAPCASNEEWNENIGQCEEIPVWYNWAEWSDCSHTCGYGTRYRSRECSVENACEGDAEEHEICFMVDCVINTSEGQGELEGTFVDIPDSNLGEAVNNEEVFEELVSSLVSDSCSSDPIACCQILNFDSEISINLEVDITPAFTCSVSVNGQESNTVRLLVTVTITVEIMESYCGVEYDYEQEDGGVELPSDVLTEVIEDNSETIEEEVGIDIEDIEPAAQTEEATTKKNKGVNDKKNANYTYLVVGLVAGAVGAAIVGILIFLAVKKCNKPKRTVSFLSMGKAAQQEPNTNFQDVEKPKMLAEPIVSDAPYSPPPYSTTSTVNWNEMRPKTGTRRHGALTPLQ